jgi:hypothetical protein
MVVDVARPDWRLPADLEYLVANALGAVLALAARVANSSTDFASEEPAYSVVRLLLEKAYGRYAG